MDLIHILQHFGGAIALRKDSVTNGLYISLQLVTETSYMLPTITIEVIRSKEKRKARCLVDTGSQQTYMKASLAKYMYSDINDVNKIQYIIQKFIGTEKKFETNSFRF